MNLNPDYSESTALDDFKAMLRHDDFDVLKRTLLDRDLRLHMLMTTLWLQMTKSTTRHFCAVSPRLLQ